MKSYGPISIFSLISIRKFRLGLILIGFLLIATYSFSLIVPVSFEYLQNYCKNDTTISTCSHKADERGFNQNIVAYSLFGPFATDPKHFNRYVSLIKKNVERIKEVYKGWFVRIYVNSTSVQDASISFLQDHFQSDSHVDVCNVTRALECRGIRLDVYPMIWRFLPLLDSTVGRMISRDTDSLVTDREVAAVKEWVESNTSFHIMRDNATHFAFILRGMWGADLLRRRNQILN